MTTTDSLGGTFTFPTTTFAVHRLGYGAMQLAGSDGPTKRVWGPPRDRDAAVAVLREAIASGVNHLDTSDFYGPHVVNQIIGEALAPYPDDLVIATKVGARRPADGTWQPAQSADELTSAVHDNLRHLGLDALDVVNFRAMGGGAGHGPAEGSIAPQITALADLQRKGLIRHLGVSNCTSTQVAEARSMVSIVCVQNQYNLAHREDDALVDDLATAGIAYVPFFPLGGFSPLQSSALDDVAKSLGATALQVALAWLLQRSPNLLLIPGTSSVAHLRENLAAADLRLPPEAVTSLDAIATRGRAYRA